MQQNPNDRIWASVSYLFWIVALVALFKRRRNSFVKHHAVVGLLISAIYWIVVLLIRQWFGQVAMGPLSIRTVTSIPFWAISLWGIILAARGRTWPFLQFNPSGQEISGITEPTEKTYTPADKIWTKFLLFIPIAIAISILFEGFVFTFYGSVFKNYPLVQNYLLWILKHVGLGVSLASFFTVWDRFMRKRLLFLLLAGPALVFIVIEQIGYKGAPFCGFRCYDIAGLMVFFIFPLILLFATILLWLLNKLLRRIPVPALSIIALGALPIVVFAVWQPLYQQSIWKKIPLQLEGLRDKEESLIFNVPFIFTSDIEGKKGDVRQRFIESNKKPILPLLNAAEHLTLNEWKDACKKFRISTLGLDVYGAQAANTCFYVGAIAYKQPQLCEETGSDQASCQIDLAHLTNSTDVCQGDRNCLAANATQLQKTGGTCEQLKTAESARAPIYIPRHDAYAQCLFSLAQKDSKMLLEQMDWSRLNAKLVVNEWYVSPNNPADSYIEFKNTSSDTITTDGIQVRISHARGEEYGGLLATHDIPPGGFLLVHGQNLNPTINDHDKLLEGIAGGSMGLYYNGDGPVGIVQYIDNMPAGNSVSRTQIGRYLPAPQTPGINNIVQAKLTVKPSAAAIRYFNEIVYYQPLKDRDPIVIKWIDKDVPIFVMGSPTAQDRSCLQNAVATFHQLTNIDMPIKDSDFSKVGSVEVKFIPRSQFPESGKNYGSFGAPTGSVIDGIDDGGMFIDVNNSVTQRCVAIYRSLGRAMGIMNFARSHPESIFNSPAPNSAAYAPIDQEVIRILYDRLINPGDTPEQVKTILGNS